MQSYPPDLNAAEQDASFHYPSSSQRQPQQQSDLQNPDELQLDAQLSRNNAPMMMNSEPGGNMTDGQDLRSQGQTSAHHQFEPEHIAQIQTDGAMDAMGSQYGTPDGSMAPRKRSKVSRACDECRRKKIRCDASGEPGDDQCSSCKRAMTTCQFSRVPMKRGPSKGYIKELADRLNTLEGALHGTDMAAQYLPHHENPMHHHPQEEFSPPPNLEAQRKRTYSAVSQGEFASPLLVPRPLGGWTPSEPPRQLQISALPFASSNTASTAAHSFREPNYSPNGIQPHPQWRNAPELSRQQSSSLEAMAREQSSSDHTLSWDEAVIDGYYQLIHPTYPILSTTINRVIDRLTICPATLREAFVESLNAAVRSYPSPYRTDVQSTRKATQLIAQSRSDNLSSRSLEVDIVYLQIMLLLAMEAQNRPPTNTGPGDPSWSLWLGSAVGLAYQMKLHVHKHSNKLTDNDADTDEKVCRRLWWVLVMMDRWHASSTTCPLLIPDSSVVLYPQDQALLGDVVYHLARMSVILGHSSTVLLVPMDLPPLSVPPGPLYGMFLRGELERFRESLPQSLLPPSSAPLVLLCYWHLRILVAITQPELELPDLLESASNTVLELVQNPGLITPLTYHATTLAALVLTELTKYENLRIEAETCLSSIMENRIAPSAWDGTVRELIANKKTSPSTDASPNLSTAEKQQVDVASASLQHLAEIATASGKSKDVAVTAEERKEEETSSASQSQPFHRLRELVRSGYLHAFTGVAAR